MLSARQKTVSDTPASVDVWKMSSKVKSISIQRQTVGKKKSQ